MMLHLPERFVSQAGVHGARKLNRLLLWSLSNGDSKTGNSRMPIKLSGGSDFNDKFLNLYLWLSEN